MIRSHVHLWFSQRWRKGHKIILQHHLKLSSPSKHADHQRDFWAINNVCLGFLGRGYNIIGAASKIRWHQCDALAPVSADPLVLSVISKVSAVKTICSWSAAEICASNLNSTQKHPVQLLCIREQIHSDFTEMKRKWVESSWCDQVRGGSWSQLHIRNTDANYQQ